MDNRTYANTETGAMPRVCELPDCGISHHDRGLRGRWCESTGGALGRSPNPARDEYVQARINITPRGCWEWTLSLHIGYGTATFQGRESMAHRFSYETYVGEIPAGLQIDHLCRNRSCVNPSHLEAVTLAENVSRSMAPSAVSRRTGYCIKGIHRMSGGNLYVSADGKRRCRSCKAARLRG